MRKDTFKNLTDLLSMGKLENLPETIRKAENMANQGLFPRKCVNTVKWIYYQDDGKYRHNVSTNPLKTKLAINWKKYFRDKVKLMEAQLKALRGALTDDIISK